MTESLTRSFIEAVYGIRAEGVAAQDLDAVRTLLLDHIGVTAGGSRTETAEVVRRMITARQEHDGLPLIGTEIWTLPPDAALANAVAGHCLEFDDTHSAGSLHPGVVVFPAALAASVLAGADAVRFIDAVLTGYEVMCRLGRAVDAAAHYRRHFHPTATTGFVAAAATAGRIFGLGVDQATEAAGTACTMAGGSLEFLSDGAWTKRLHPGLAARGGLFAAQLAAAGFRGPRDGIGGRHGFLAAFTDAAHPELLLAGFGTTPLEIRNTSVKAHGCCRYNQGPIDAVLEIRRRESLRAEDVASIKVGVVSPALTLVWDPPEAKRHPASVVDAQFSLPYSLAIALCEGRADPSEYEPVRHGDPQLQRLIDSVDCVADPELERHYPEQWRCWVEVKTIDGRTVSAKVDQPKGEPGNPFSAKEVLEKAARLTEDVYSRSRLDAIATAVAALPGEGSLAALVPLLAAG